MVTERHKDREKRQRKRKTTERHNIASRIFLKGVSKGPLGAGLISMDIGSADRIVSQNLQVAEHSTNRTFPKNVFPRLFLTNKYLLLVTLMQCKLFQSKEDTYGNNNGYGKNLFLVSIEK
eukprot:scaffold15158_cov17-Tisochrysis_lutea.AAC.1